MKIANIIRSTDPKGGGVIGSVAAANIALAELGHSTAVISLDPDPKHAPWRLREAAPSRSFGAGAGKYGLSSSLIAGLRSLISEFDVFVVHGLWQFHSPAVRWALRRSGKPYFVFPHGMLDPWFARRYPLKHAKKWIYWTLLEQHVLRDAAGVLFASEEECVLARQSFQRYQAKEFVVGLGLVEPRIDFRAAGRAFLAAFPALQQRRSVLFLGRIHPKKGCDILIRAFAEAARDQPDLMLVMAGPDQQAWRGKLKRLARRAGIGDRIVWTGMIEGPQKWGALATAEIFVLPSHQENFGLAVVEALATGTPVLISNKVNIWREIQADGAGLICSDEVHSTARTLARYLAMTPLEQRRMRERARACFQHRFEAGQAASRLVEALSTALPAPSANEQQQIKHKALSA